MDMITTGCPHCGTRFRTDRVYDGKEARCNKCGETFVIRAGNAAPPVHAAPADSPPPVVMGRLGVSETDLPGVNEMTLGPPAPAAPAVTHVTAAPTATPAMAKPSPAIPAPPFKPTGRPGPGPRDMTTRGGFSRPGVQHLDLAAASAMAPGIAPTEYVLLLRRQLNVDFPLLTLAASKAFGVDPRGRRAAQCSTQGSAIVVHIQNCTFHFIESGVPRWANPAGAAAAFADARLRRAVAAHRATLAIRLVHRTAALPLESVYQGLGRFMVFVVGVDCLAIFAPQRELWTIYDESVRAHLSGLDGAKVLTTGQAIATPPADG